MHVLGKSISITCGLWAVPGLVINVLSGSMPPPMGCVVICDHSKMIGEDPGQTSFCLMTARTFEFHFENMENKTQKSQILISGALPWAVVTGERPSV